MARLERAGMAKCAPKLNPKGDPDKWLSDKARAVGEAGQRKAEGRDHRLRQAAEAWKEGKVR